MRLFAALREQAGVGSLELELADGATVAEALQSLVRSGPLAEVPDRLAIAIAVNREYADNDTPLREHDELALIPPVSGGAYDERGEAGAGAARVHVRLSTAPLSLDRAAALVRHPAAGALVVFCGMTRAVERLEYEAYAEMAEERMRAIGLACADRHGLEAIAIEHRIGSVPLGEASVVVAAAAAHRAEAFAAAREAIDAVKEQVPIWKREVDGGGRARWVEGHAVGVSGQGPARA